VKIAYRTGFSLRALAYPHPTPRFRVNGLGFGETVLDSNGPRSASSVTVADAPLDMLQD
jgi:hypothetical protein